MLLGDFAIEENKTETFPIQNMDLKTGKDNQLSPMFFDLVLINIMEKAEYKRIILYQVIQKYRTIF